MTAMLTALHRSRDQIVPALQTAVQRLDPSSRLQASYHLGWCDADGKPTEGGGGKAVRPALALLSAEAAGATAEVGVPGAVGVELVHNFSLLHDDLMDGDLERRHRRTVWAIWGAPAAILAGDALLALAHEVVLESPSPHAGRAALLLATTTRELTRGQVQDVAFESRSDVTLDECLDMASGKTGALLAASAAIGAVLAGAPEDVVDALTTFGGEVGLAFQLVDDVLGIWGDPTVTGKPVHGDLRERKKTFPVLAALDSDTPGALRLATLLEAGGDPEEAATLIETTGGRSAALAEARRHITAVETALADAALETGAVDELRSLLGYLVRRDL